MRSAQEWISILRLEPHPEGGYYRETYRSEIRIVPVDGALPLNRSAATTIYYLLPRGTFSAFHRLTSDEGWYFHAGGSLVLISIDRSGMLRRQVLGDGEGEELHIVIPAGRWFAAFPREYAEYALVSCSVSPGFEFEDFEMATRTRLLSVYPEHKNWIRRLTREEE